MKRLVLAAVLTVAACSHSAPRLVRSLAPVEATVFEDVAVFAGDTTAVTEHQDVWVRNGRIEFVGPTGGRPAPQGAQIVAGAGRTLLPGLIDMHTHTLGSSSPPWALSLPDPERNLKAFLYAGVTTLVDLAGETEEVTGLRDDVKAGEVVGPRMLVAGQMFTAVDGHPVAMLRAFAPWPVSWLLEDSMAYQIDATEEVADVFAEFLEYKPDVVKITSDQIPLGIPTMNEAVAAEITARARAAGLTVFAHVGDNADAQKVARAGVDILAHGIYREAVSEATARLLAEKNVAVVPTLVVFDNIDRLAHGDYALTPLQREVGDPDTLTVLAEGRGDHELTPAFDAWAARTYEHRQHKFENVAILRKHGVTILVGSDSPNLGQFGGASLHDEMDLLVRTGMTPAEVLQAATYRNAQALKLDAEIGSIAPGKQADLLLVEGDPTRDIAAAHRIVSVYLGGRKVERTLE